MRLANEMGPAQDARQRLTRILKGLRGAAAALRNMIATCRSKLASYLRLLREEACVRWRHIAAGIRRSKPFWLRLGGWLAFAMLAFIPCLLPTDELADCVRRSGMLFQFLGLATVTRGLMITRREVFDKPPLWEGTIQSIGRFLRGIIRPPKPVSLTGDLRASAAMAGGIMVADVNVTVEERVARLEKHLQELAKETRRTHRDMEERINKEHDEREVGDRRVSKQLEEAVIGGIHLEVGGLAYLFVGILFTSVPQETAWLLQKIGL